MFDAAFFGITPREALVMNPQQRVFLECAWEALERAGYASGTYRGRIGVYAAEGQNPYLLNVLSHPEWVRALGSAQVMLSNTASVATLASYKLDLEGPSMSVQTACSSSLVAVDLACRSLLDGVSDVALAGGVRIDVPQGHGYHHQAGGIMSPTGECTPFDAEARGTVAGSGAGVVVLKRLEDALADGDMVLATIRGSAVNNDGGRKVGFTTPRREGQARAISDALAAAGVEPGEISYVETHGSGTEVGDPIEVAALMAAFGEGEKRTVALGAVKSSVGHLDAAAGVAGLIKTVLALHHGEIPPSPYFREPNPKIDFDQVSPLYGRCRTGRGGFEQPGHRDVLGEHQRGPALRQDRGEQLVEQVELVGPAGETNRFGLLEELRRVVADLLQPGEQGEDEPATGVLVGAFDALHRVAHERLVEHDLLAGQAERVVGLGLGWQLGARCRGRTCADAARTARRGRRTAGSSPGGRLTRWARPTPCGRRCGCRAAPGSPSRGWPTAR